MLGCPTHHGGQRLREVCECKSRECSVDWSTVRDSWTGSMKGETVVVFIVSGTNEQPWMRGLDLRVILASAAKHFSVLTRMSFDARIRQWRKCQPEGQVTFSGPFVRDRTTELLRLATPAHTVLVSFPLRRPLPANMGLWPASR
jgi:hypothetical protein